MLTMWMLTNTVFTLTEPHGTKLTVQMMMKRIVLISEDEWNTNVDISAFLTLRSASAPGVKL